MQKIHIEERCSVCGKKESFGSSSDCIMILETSLPGMAIDGNPGRLIKFHRGCATPEILAIYQRLTEDLTRVERMDKRFDLRKVDVPRLLAELSIQAIGKGRLWVAACPKHQAEWFSQNNVSPGKGSWFITDDKGEPKNGLQHCFGCGFGGTAVDLVQQVLDIEYSSAIEFIKERAYGELIPYTSIKVNFKSLSRPVFKIPPGVIFEPLDEWPTAARNYLTERQVTPYQVDKWNLGYSIQGRLAGRIFIPICNAKGVLTSYMARSYCNHDRRYLEPTEEEKPDIDSVFGEHQWSKTRETLILSEGAFNCLALERAFPFVDVGALRGSNVTPKKILKLATFKRIIVVTDNDRAGINAEEKLKANLDRHIEYKRVLLPEEEDANSLPVDVLRTHFEGVKEWLENWQ